MKNLVIVLTNFFFGGGGGVGFEGLCNVFIDGLGN